MILYDLKTAIYLGQSGQKPVAVSSLAVDEKYLTPAASAFASCAFQLPKIKSVEKHFLLCKHNYLCKLFSYTLY